VAGPQFIAPLVELCVPRKSLPLIILMAFDVFEGNRPAQADSIWSSTSASEKRCRLGAGRDKAWVACRRWMRLRLLQYRVYLSWRFLVQ
jgi:hypothetical protein